MVVKGFIVKKVKNKGFGLFASKNYNKDEMIFHVNLNKFRKYRLKDIRNNDKLNIEHSNYIGNDKYVIDTTKTSYMNHSCNPNCYIKMKSIAIYDICAMRNIKKGEELTDDYTATSIDQFAGKGFWKFKCSCGSRNCRKTIHGDFFKMPKIWQKKYYKNLPNSIRRKYKNKFRF